MPLAMGTMPNQMITFSELWAVPLAISCFCGCGSDDLGLGWQHGEAIVTFKKHGLLGNRLRYLICRRCGAVVYQWVAEPHKFPPVGGV